MFLLKYPLYLASESLGRKNLLEEIGLTFKTISHCFDEIIDVNIKENDLEGYVRYISLNKFKSVNIELINEDDFIVLTADTMVYSNFLKKIIGKPKDFQEAELFLNSMSKKSSIAGTAFNIGLYKNKKLIFSDSGYNFAKIFLTMSIYEIKEYIDKNQSNILSIASGISIKNAMQYIYKINGSYSSIIGLPIYEIFKLLKKINIK